MTLILNDNTARPKPYVIQSFKNGSCKKTMIPKGTRIYRIVSKEDSKKNVSGNNTVSGEFWIDHQTFLKISAQVNYEEYTKSITNLARNGLALTSDFSITADSVICVTVLQNVYGWVGTAARQLETFNNGMKMLYRGGLTQLWIPNLNENIVRYQFFHSI